jgi:uridylate kinase
MAIKYRRILLKVSGEAFARPGGFGIDIEKVEDLAQRIKQVKEMGGEVAVVVGAGNIWRGKIGMSHGMERATAD